MLWIAARTQKPDEKLSC